MIFIYFKHIVFKDLAKGVYQSLRDLNFDVQLTDKLTKNNDDIFIIFGANDFLEFLPEKYIIYQLEQTNIYENGKKKNLPEKYIHIMRNAIQIWDYSSENIKCLDKTYNLKNLKYVPILYSPAFQTIQNINEKYNKPIDILFIGALNKRRESILNKLKMNKNLIIEVGNYNIWDEKRDYLVEKSKIILNIHFSENSILETARISYLIANRSFVISENGRDKKLRKQFDSMMIFSQYNNLVETCLNYIKKPERCIEIAENGYELFKKLKYKDILPLEKLSSFKSNANHNKKNTKKKSKLDIFIPIIIKEAPTENQDGNYLLKMPKIDEKDLPHISIITPTGNRRSLFSIALKNFQSFIYPREKMEWIILDDGTEVMNDLIPKDPLIKYIKMDCDGNRLPIGCKRNKAIEYASNDYILFMDDDDYYSPESVLARVKFLIDSEIECVGCSSVGCYNLINDKSVLAEDSNNLLCEGSLAFTKKFWEERKFDEGDLDNESKYFLQYRQSKLLSIPYQFIMIAFNHRSNLTNSLRNYENFDEWIKNNAEEYINLYDTFDVITQIFINDLKKILIKDYKNNKNLNSENNNMPSKMSYTIDLPR